MNMTPYCLAVALCLSLFGNTVYAGDSDLETMKKELRIFSKVLKASFGDEDDVFHRSRDRDTLAPRNIEFIYLQDQGVIVHIQLGADRFALGDFSDFGDIHFFPDEALIPDEDFELETAVLAEPGRELSEEELDLVRAQAFERIENARLLAEQTDEMVLETGETMREAMGILADTPFSSRETASALRDLKLKSRVVFKDTRKKILELKRKLRKKKELSEEDRQNLEAELETYRQEIKKQTDEFAAKAREIRMKQQQEWELKLGRFEDTLLDVVCDYGASIKSLPPDQHFTIVLAHADHSEKRSRARVLVFRKADLVACRDGKITKDNLKTKSHVYAF